MHKILKLSLLFSFAFLFYPQTATCKGASLKNFQESDEPEGFAGTAKKIAKTLAVDYAVLNAVIAGHEILGHAATGKAFGLHPQEIFIGYQKVEVGKKSLTNGFGKKLFGTYFHFHPFPWGPEGGGLTTFSADKFSKLSKGKKVASYLSGPAFNLITGLMAYHALYGLESLNPFRPEDKKIETLNLFYDDFYGKNGLAKMVASSFATTSIALGILNLIPLEGSDGSKILKVFKNKL